MGRHRDQPLDFGSQLASYAWGAANVIFVVGAQKLVPTLQAAHGTDLPAQPGAGRRTRDRRLRLAIKAGYPVTIATSGDPEDIALITELVIPGAQPRRASDAVADADIVVLAMPLHRFLDVAPGLLSGKLVVDAMNYWPASDGVNSFRGRREQRGRGPAAGRLGRGQGAQSHRLSRTRGPGAASGRPWTGGPPALRAMIPAAVAAVAVVERIGDHPVRPGSLRAGRVLQPGGPVFGVVLSLPEFELRQGRFRSLTCIPSGLDTFGDRNSDADGKPALRHAQTIRNVVEEGVFAERAGVDFFGIGEHHTNYFPMRL